MSECKSIIIEVFRAIDNVELCNEYIAGHRKVLTSYNIPKITSDNNKWAQNENVYVLVVKTPEGEIVGGARIHVRDEHTRLPVEEAFSEKHDDFKGWISKFQGVRTGEMCGLWNAKAIAGSGVSLILTRSIMAKSGLVVANQLKLNVLICLCAPWTVKLVKQFGFSVATGIGDNGSYPYPKPDLPATILYIRDTEELSSASPVQRSRVFDLRNIPVQKTIEDNKDAQMEVNYNLLISNLDLSEV